jgi:hypothetical protein
MSSDPKDENIIGYIDDAQEKAANKLSEYYNFSIASAPYKTGTYYYPKNPKQSNPTTIDDFEKGTMEIDGDFRYVGFINNLPTYEYKLIDEKGDVIKVDKIYKKEKKGGKRKSRRNRKSKKGKRSRKARKSRRKSKRRRGRR